jgi:hypothetical protein
MLDYKTYHINKEEDEDTQVFNAIQIDRQNTLRYEQLKEIYVNIMRGILEIWGQYSLEAKYMGKKSVPRPPQSQGAFVKKHFKDQRESREAAMRKAAEKRERDEKYAARQKIVQQKQFEEARKWKAEAQREAEEKKAILLLLDEAKTPEEFEAARERLEKDREFKTKEGYDILK